MKLAIKREGMTYNGKTTTATYLSNIDISGTPINIAYNLGKKIGIEEIRLPTVRLTVIASEAGCYELRYEFGGMFDFDEMYETEVYSGVM